MLNDRSLRALAGVHPDLVRVVQRAAGITRQPFLVTEGLRTLERQKQLVAKGASKTLRSRHLTGHAIDVAAAMPGGAVSWDSEPLAEIARAMKQAGRELGVPVEWGGDWRTFTDTPHFQLPWGYTGAAAEWAAKAPNEVADGWHTETMIAAEPPEPGRSKTKLASALQAAGGGGLTAADAASVFSAVSSSPQGFTASGFAMALLASPVFWTGLGIVSSAVFVWLERHDKLKTWGI